MTNARNLVTSFLSFLIIAGSSATASAVGHDVPLPRPKPDRPNVNGNVNPKVLDAPIPRLKPARRGKASTETPQAAPPKQVVPKYDPTIYRACLEELRRLGAEFTEVPTIVAEPPCGVEKPLRLESLPDGVEIRGKPTLNCATTLALSQWIETAVKTTAKDVFGAPLKRVDLSTSYQCRRRNNA